MPLLRKPRRAVHDARFGHVGNELGTESNSPVELREPRAQRVVRILSAVGVSVMFFEVEGGGATNEIRLVGTFFIVTMLAAVWIVAGPWTPETPAEVFLTMLFFVAGPLGSLWMIYQAFRFENEPLRFLILAFFVPMSFLWYYFNRVLPFRATRKPNGRL